MELMSGRSLGSTTTWPHTCTSMESEPVSLAMPCDQHPDDLAGIGDGVVPARLGQIDEASVEHLGDRELDQLLLALVVAVDGARRQSGLRDDVGHRRGLEALACEAPQGGGGDLAAAGGAVLFADFRHDANNKKECSFLTSDTQARHHKERTFVLGGAHVRTGSPLERRTAGTPRTPWPRAIVLALAAAAVVVVVLLAFVWPTITSIGERRPAGHRGHQRAGRPGREGARRRGGRNLRRDRRGFARRSRRPHPHPRCVRRHRARRHDPKCSPPRPTAAAVSQILGQVAGQLQAQANAAGGSGRATSESRRASCRPGRSPPAIDGQGDRRGPARVDRCARARAHGRLVPAGARRTGRRHPHLPARRRGLAPARRA